MNELIRMNNIQNPNHLSIGQVLNVPKGTSPSQPSSPAPNPTNTYTVKSGDSLHRISQQYGVTVDALVSANKLQNRDFIYVGQILTIPATPVRQPEASFNHTVSQLAAMFPSTFYLKGSGNSKRIALTFDDGPDTHYTPQVLDVLKKYNVPATFYLMGSRAEGNPGIVRRIISEGHVIGNHTWSHPDLGNVSQSRVITEIQRTEDALFNITGLRTATMRPPYGAVNKDVLDQLKTMNYRVINWSVDSKDWRDRSVDQILINTLPDVREEAILLFHSAGGEGQSLKATVDALPELIETLRMQGYTFTTVDKLLGIPAYK